jgi:UDP-glucose 4-epimerase
MKKLPEGISGKKILVTGGAGFVGSHIVDRLAPENEVIILDDLSTGKPENLATSKEKIKFIRGDIRDAGLVKDIISGGIDIVFHLAARTSVVGSIEDPLLDMDTNVRGTLTILEACRGSNIQRLVYVSSAAVYGDVKKLPVDEDSSLNPGSPYAVSKMTAEKYCLIYQKVYNLPVAAVRCFNIYGPRQSAGAYANAISIFLRNIVKGEPLTIYGDGEQTRDLVYIDDAASGCLAAAASPGAVGGVFNIASGTAVTVNRLVKIILKVTGENPVINHSTARAGEIRYSQARIAKAANVLGYKPQTTLESGIKAAWQELNKI